MRKLRAAGALADRPGVGCRRFQPVVNADIAVSVQLDAGFLQPNPRSVRNTPRRGQDVAALDLLVTGGCAHGQADAVARSALDIEGLRLEEKLNPFSPQNSVHFIDDVGILAGHQLRPGLDHGHAAAEAAISLRQFEADIAAAEHHQMRGCIVEFERLDMGQRPGGFEAGNRGN